MEINKAVDVEKAIWELANAVSNEWVNTHNCHEHHDRVACGFKWRIHGETTKTRNKLRNIMVNEI